MHANPWQSVLAFWFGQETDDAKVADSQAKLWWKKDDETDRAIRHRFGALVERAGRGELDHWASDANGLLALIVLTDQFTRNMYRDTPQAFAQDEQALAWCRHMLEHDLDRKLRPVERLFAYLPLEHSEDLQDQHQCIQLMQSLAASVPAHQRETFEGFVDYAERHRVIIERFGRFPHRNAILGRSSTEQELAFLRQPGSSF